MLRKRLLHCRLPPFLEQEQGQLQYAALASQVAQGVGLFLYGVTDEYQRLYAALAVLGLGVAQQAGYLGVSTLAVHLPHQLGQLRTVSEPLTGEKLVETTVVTQLHSQRGDLAGAAKHLLLQVTGTVPGGLAAGRGVYGE